MAVRNSKLSSWGKCLLPQVLNHIVQKLHFVNTAVHYLTVNYLAAGEDSLEKNNAQSKSQNVKVKFKIRPSPTQY